MNQVWMLHYGRALKNSSGANMVTSQGINDGSMN